MKRLAIAVVAALMLAGPLAASAFSVSPPRFTFIIDPGNKRSGTVTIHNSDKETEIFNLSVVGAKQNKNGSPEFGTGLDVAEEWVHLEKKSVQLPPGTGLDVAFAIAVPAVATPQAHYFGIAVDNAPVGASSVGVTGRLVTLVYLQVAGVVTEGLEATHWGLEPSAFWDKNRTAFISLTNNGTVPVRATGQLQILNREGEILFKNDIVFGNEILPGSVRSRLVSVALKKKITMPGFYNVKLIVDYGKTKQQLHVAQSFIFVPLWSVVGVVVLLLVIIISLVVFRRTRKKARYKE